MPFTPDSGPCTLTDRLAALGIELDHAQIDEVLARARQLITREGRLLSDADLATLAREVR